MTSRIGITMVTVALLAIASIDAGATKYTFVNTEYGRGGGSDVYHYDGTSASALWDDSTATDVRHSTAYADFGVLKVTTETTMAGGTGGRADANAAWQDNVVFTADNAALAGQGGIATVVLSVSGSLVEVRGNDNVDFVNTYARILLQKNTADGGWWNWERAQAGPTPADCIGTFSIDIPIVFGEHFDLTVTLAGTSESHAYYYTEANGTAKVDLGNSLYWGGVTKVVDSNGTEVAYSVTSESGHNWAASSVPGATPPVDNTTSSSSSGGTCSMAPGRGSDALSGTVALLTLFSPMAWLWAARRRERRNR